MFKIDNRELRNLEEQVLKNKQDIANHYAIDRSLANFGIKIVGTVASVDDLPDPLNYTGVYGDGYAVGQPGEYTYYIYTRPDPNSGHPENYWLDVGQISIVGPQGSQGETGERGPAGESSKWYIGDSFPTNAKENDMLINSTGKVFQYTSNAWVYVTDLKGPQGVQGIQGPQGERGETGPQGPQGQKGDVGGLINIAGTLTSEEQLPTPASLNNLTFAYLINGDLYIQLGTAPTNAQWYNVGPFNVGTICYVNGEYVNTLEMDNYIEKPTTTTFSNRVPYIGAQGFKTYYYNVATNDTASIINSIVQYKGSESGNTLPANTPGYLTTASPRNNYHCANKKYVDDAISRVHPAQEYLFNSRITLPANEEQTIQYAGISSLNFFRQIVIMCRDFTNNYYTATISAPILEQAGANKIKTSPYFEFKIEGYNSPAPTLTIKNLTGEDLIEILVVSH